MTRILLVEDNPADALLLQEALRVAEVAHPVDHVTDGQQAIDFLRAAAQPPGLMLLDLNLPRKDGREVLAEVKGDPALRNIPVIVLTTSSAPSDVSLAYERGANAFVRKPLGMDRLIEAAGAIRDFWLRTATLPTEA
jgi:CheY-like chemotaxis protein